MGLADRLANAVDALFGGGGALVPSVPSDPAFVKTAESSRGDTPGVVYGDPKVLDLAAGILTGVVPYGLPPMRGGREVLIALKRDPVMWAATDKIATAVSAVPWRLYRARDKRSDVPGDAKSRYLRKRARILRDHPSNKRKREKFLSDARREEDVEEVLDHPFLDMLDGANPTMTGHSGSHITQKILDGVGEVFWILERNSLGFPVQYWPVPAFWCYRTPYEGQPFYYFLFGTYQAYLPEADVVWMKHLDPENPYGRGTGPGLALGDEIDTDEYASKVLKAFFYNQGVPATLVAFEGASDANTKAAQEKWKQENGGWQNALRTHFTNLKVHVEQLSPSFTDQKLIELRKSLRDQKLHTYGVPPEIMGIVEHSNRSTIDVAQFIMASNVTVPRLEFRRSFYQTRLLPEYRDPSLVTDFDNPTPDDVESRRTVMVAVPWAFKVDEFRALADAEPLGGPDGEERPPMPSAGAAPTETEKPTSEPSAPKPPSPSAGGGKRKARKTSELDDDDVDVILEQLKAEIIAGELRPVWEAETRKWMATALEEVGVDASLDLINPLVSKFVDAFAGDRIADFNDTTRGQLREVLNDGIEAGSSIDEIAGDIEDTFDDIDSGRAETIARTEVGYASNAASTAAYELSGLVSKREWVATQDDRVRDDHDEMDGQTVDMDEPFTAPDGATAMFPGDFGVGEQDINCRCTTAPIVEDVDTGDLGTDDGSGDDSGDVEEDAARVEVAKCRRVVVVDGVRKNVDRVTYWKSYDAKLRPWESQALSALRLAFAKQKHAVIRTLKSLR